MKEKELPTNKGIRFNDEYERIKKYGKDTAEEELLYLLIPRSARSIYTIRSKKKGQHSRENDLLNIDLGHVVSTCNWIMANLLFAVHRIPEDEAVELMLKTVRFTPPILIEYDGYFVPTKKGIEPLDALLVMLTSCGGEALFSDLSKQLKVHFSKGQTYDALKKAQIEKFVFRHPESGMVVMLDEGRKKSEQIVQRAMLE